MFESNHQNIDLAPAIRALQIGEHQRALKWAEHAVDVFWKNGDIRVGHALAIYNFANRAGGAKASPFEDMSDLPADAVGKLADESLELAQELNGNWCVDSLVDVWQFVEQEFGVGSELANQLSVAIKEKSYDFEAMSDVDPLWDDDRIALRQQEILRLEVKKQMELACEETLLLARDLSAAGRQREAIDCYRTAIDGASQLEDPSAKIDAFLQCGAYLDRLGRSDQAESLLRRAAGLAKQSRQREMYAEVMSALGICLFHLGKVDSAKKALYQSLKLLGLESEKAQPVLRHLDCINRDVACDCEPLEVDSMNRYLDDSGIEVA